MLVLVIIAQRMEFITIFVSLLGEVNRTAPEHGPFVLAFLILAVANTMMLVDCALVIAGLRKRMR